MFDRRFQTEQPVRHSTFCQQLLLLKIFVASLLNGFCSCHPKVRNHTPVIIWLMDFPTARIRRTNNQWVNVVSDKPETRPRLVNLTRPEAQSQLERKVTINTKIARMAAFVFLDSQNEQLTLNILGASNIVESRLCLRIGLALR